MMEKSETKIIITDLVFQNRKRTLCCLLEGDRLARVQVLHPSILGNIYVAKVQQIVKNLHAAFVESGPGAACYLSLAQLKNPLYVKKTSPKPLAQGDEIVVQVIKEAVKTKAPLVSATLNLTGRYVAVTSEGGRLGTSRKLPEDVRQGLKDALAPFVSEEFGIVVRTNAARAQISEVVEELQALKSQWEHLVAHATMRTCFSCLYEAEPGHVSFVQNAGGESLAEIVTDLPYVYNSLAAYCGRRSDLKDTPLRLYTDASYPLTSLYRINTQLERAVQKTVWLKSGAFLVIEPTEALTVIDVNTGKSMAKKDVQAHFLQVNLEASKEIARQLRLRNISGIVIVDYIDLQEEADQKALLQYLKEQIKDDPVQVTLHGMTKLNLVELTRKKVEKSLLEQLS